MEQATLAIAVASLVVSVIALVTAAYQYALAESQTGLARRQTELAQAQHQFTLEQMALRPVLSFSYQYSRFGADNEWRPVLDLVNWGKTPATDVHFEIQIPDGFGAWDFIAGNVSDGLVKNLGDASYSGQLAVPLTPARAVSVMRATAAGPGIHTAPTMRWRLYSRDGQFPADGSFAELDVSWMQQLPRP